MEAVTAVRVVASASHVIELLDAGHHSVRVKANVPVVGGRHRRLALNDGSDAVGGCADQRCVLARMQGL